MFYKRVNISRWPAITGQASAAQEAWPPVQRPPPVGAQKLFLQAPAEDVIRAPQSQAYLRQQTPQDFRPPEEPAQFSPGKGQSPRYFVGQSDTRQAAHGSPGASHAAAHPSSHRRCGAGLPHGAPAPKGVQGWPLEQEGHAASRRSYFTDEETESQSVIPTCSRDSLVTVCSSCGLPTGTSVLSEV